MPHNLPPGSVSGQHGWEWNRLIAQHQSESTASTPTQPPNQPKPNRTPTRPHAPSDEPADGRTFEATLNHKDRQLQDVIDRYEQLLADRNRQLAERRDTAALCEKLLAAVPDFLPIATTR